jgi:nitrile hydratase accessory protein
MNKTLPASELEALNLPCDNTTPVFAAPWEAAAFAMVLTLHRAGYFEWREWVELLAHEIAVAAPDPTGDLYYQRWTRALEKLLEKLGLLNAKDIGARTESWRRAYLATPHGQEVKLTAGSHSV